MQITAGPLAGLLIIETKTHTDERGYFREVYQTDRYTEHGLPSFVQDNFSYSKYGVIRGLHYQKPYAQGKLVWVTWGEIWDVVVDIRKQSKTFGQWFTINLSAENGKQFYIPPGFAHGFCVLSEEAVFNYKCSERYAPGCEQGIAWNDDTLKIEWPINSPIISGKDASYPMLKNILEENLFIE